MSPRAPEELVRLLTQGSLVRVNRTTDQLEPRLAKSWTTSPDGLTWTLTLRDDVRFSDGRPFTAADVVFTFRAIYDDRVKSPMAGSLLVSGKPLTVRAIDDRTVTVAFPAPYGSGLALLEGVPILPRHKLEAALDLGRFHEAWGVTTSPDEMTGLGPFALREYTPGVRLIFARNPHYWKRDDAGVPLPYLDEIELQIVPEQNAEVLQLESGATDLINDFVRPEDLSSLSKLAELGRVQVVPLGPTIGPDLFWTNLAPGASAASNRPWLQREEFRKAISHGVDRQSIVNTVYLGEAVPIEGPITSGFGAWHAPAIPLRAYDPDQAKALLRSIGLEDRNKDGRLEDPAGRAARFTVVAQKGQSLRERTMALVQKQLSDIGLQVDLLLLDVNSLIGVVQKGDYDAVFFYITPESPDPNRLMDFWLSSGGFHLWNPGQTSPATPWEGEIDDLMKRQSATFDMDERRKLFAQAQKVFWDHLPAIYFVAQHQTVVMSARVQGATPSVVAPPVLWNAEALSLRQPISR